MNKILGLVGLVGLVGLTAVGQTATPIRFSMRECTGSTADRTITVLPLDGPLGFFGTNLVPGGQFPLRSSGGLATTNLVIGNYRFSFNGLTRAMTVFWPGEFDLSVSNAADARIQRDGLTAVYFVTNSSGQWVRPGTNLTAVTNGSGLVTMSLASNVTNLFMRGQTTFGSQIVQSDTSAGVLENIITNASAGTTIYIPAGIYNVTNAMLTPRGVKLVGAGNRSTILRNYVWESNGPCITMSDNSYVGYLQITNAMMSLDYQACIGVKSDSQGAAVSRFTNGVTEHLLCLGDADAWYCKHTNSCDWIDYYSEFRSKWDVAATQGATHTNTLYGTKFIANGPSVFSPSGPTRIFTLQNCTNFVLHAYDCVFDCSGGGSGQSQIFDASALTRGDIQFWNCDFVAGSWNGLGTLPAGALKFYNSPLLGSFDSIFDNATAPTFQPWIAVPQIIDTVGNGITFQDDDFLSGHTWLNRFGVGNLFSGRITNSVLTASKGVFTDANKALTSTGMLGVDQGGTGISTYQNTNLGGVFWVSSTNPATMSITTNNAGAGSVLHRSASGAGGIATGSPYYGKVHLGGNIGTKDVDDVLSLTDISWADNFFSGNRALVSDGSFRPQEASTTTTELNWLSGRTGSILTNNESVATVFSNTVSIDAAHRLTISNASASSVAGFDGGHALTNINIGSGLSFSGNTLTASGSGTVTSVAETVPAEMSISGSPVTTSGTLALSWATETANKVFSGPSSGGAVAPTFRSLVANDIPATINRITTYNGDTTAGVGVPTIVANVVLTGQTSGLGPTTIFTAPSTGIYICFANLECTTTGASGGITVTVNNTDNAGATSKTSASLGFGSLTRVVFSYIPLVAVSGSTITYTVSAPTASGAYALSLSLIRLN